MTGAPCTPAAVPEAAKRPCCSSASDGAAPAAVATTPFEVVKHLASALAAAGFADTA